MATRMIKRYCPFILLILAVLLPASPVYSIPETDTCAPGVPDIHAVRAGPALPVNDGASYDISALPDYIRIKRMAEIPPIVQAIEFRHYVKGVLPHEWYSTWPAEALKAGAMAAKTYAWYWVNEGDRHPDCDLYDTSADQVYDDDTTASTNQAVDDTWLTGMKITGQAEVFESQYWDGLATINTATLEVRSSPSTGAGIVTTLNSGDQVCVLSNGTTTADGYHWFFIKTGGVTDWTTYVTGWVPGESVTSVNMDGNPVITELGDRLTQWGTYYWANQGKDYRWILQYFYTGTEFFTTAQQPAGNFTIAVLPDTQFYSASYPATFTAQTQWIRDNRISRNIVFVTHEGDVVDNNANWNNANTAMSLLDGQAPYGIAPGNNDGAPGNTANFNTFFPYTRYSTQGWYGGHYGTNNDNSYQLFSGGGMDFVILHIEYAADAGVLPWADGIIKAYPARRAIITSHYLINGDGSFGTWANDLYTALRGNPNLFLMLCGHLSAESLRADTYNGNTVHTLLADYQGRSNGGDGWLRLLEFNPAANTISVSTYSPTLNQYETDADSQFEISISSVAPSAPALASPSNGGPFSGPSVNFTWAASPGATQYRLQVNSNSSFTGTSKYDSIVTGTSQAVTGFSNNGSTYYWRVYAGNASDQWSAASSTYSFINGNTLTLSRRIGIYRPSNHIWALDFNGNGAWNPGIDKVSSFGATGDLPVTGKWDGLGATKAGIYRPAQKIWALDYNGNGTWNSGTDKAYSFGASGDLPVTGDWNGDGKTEIGIYRPAQMIWALDYNGNGAWNSGIDRVYSFGASGDTPVTGDWNGDGRTEIGIYRVSSNTWALDYNGNGKWDPGIDRVYTFGVGGDLPITGDWNGNARAEIGIYRPSDKTWHLDYNGDGVLTPGVDVVLGIFGTTNDIPVVGTTW